MSEETGTGYNGGIKKGLTIDRYFSSDDGNVYGGLDWKKSRLGHQGNQKPRL